jgi:tripartite-type tricarboxylate transporter receptor subunit TctC
LALPALALFRATAAGAGATTITLVVGGRAGSGPDNWARSFAPFLERHWPHAAVTVLNRPGEAGLAAARAIAEAPPDGSLIGSVATPLLQARAVEAGSVALLDGLDFIAAVAEEPLVLVGHPGTVDDLAALRALGSLAVLGTPPHGSAPQLAGLAFGLALPLNTLVFPNAAAARQAVVAGNIACAMLAAPDAIAGLRDGRLVALGVAQDSRSPLLPEVPTLQEQGIPLVLMAHRGFAVPRGVPPARLAPLTVALRAAVADPEFAAQAQAQGYVPRFLGQRSWEPMLRRTTAELVARWATDPWRGQRD